MCGVMAGLVTPFFNHESMDQSSKWFQKVPQIICMCTEMRRNMTQEIRSSPESPICQFCSFTTNQNVAPWHHIPQHSLLRHTRKAESIINMWMVLVEPRHTWRQKIFFLHSVSSTQNNQGFSHWENCHKN